MITNSLAVIIAGVTPSIIGFIWYHPRLFGAHWMQLSRIQPQHAVGVYGAVGMTVLGLLSSMVMAAVVQKEIQIDTNIIDALIHVSLLWIGFVATIGLGVVLWERKPISLYCITVTYWLVSLLVMTLVLFYLN